MGDTERLCAQEPHWALLGNITLALVIFIYNNIIYSKTETVIVINFCNN